MRRNERGIALLLCIAALMVLTAIAIGLMYMTDTETQINANYRSSQQAYFAALAGLQNVRERMTPANVPPHLIVGPVKMPGTEPGSVMYVLNPPGTVTLATIADASSHYYDNEVQTELTAQNAWPPAAGPGTYTSTPEDPPMGALDYKWVRITLKANASVKANDFAAPYYTDSGFAAGTPICYTGSDEIPAPKIILNGAPIADCFAGGGGANPPGWTPVYHLSALAVTPSGSSRMLQMEVAQDPPIEGRGAVDSQDSVHLNGQLTINGYDYCSCQCTKLDNKGNCVGIWVDRAGKVCDRSKYSIYASGTIDPPKPSETFDSGQTPAVVGNQPWPWDLDGLISRFSDGAVDVTGKPYNWNCTGGNCGTQAGPTFGVPPNFPPDPPDNPSGPGNMASQVTYIPGSAHLTGNSQGYGILIVDGNLEVNGGLNFYGLIIVKGVIAFTGGGKQAVNIYGGVIAGEQSFVDNKLGGSVNINYDYCALPQPDKNQPPRILSFRELNF